VFLRARASLLREGGVPAHIPTRSERFFFPFFLLYSAPSGAAAHIPTRSERGRSVCVWERESERERERKDFDNQGNVGEFIGKEGLGFRRKMKPLSWQGTKTKQKKTSTRWVSDGGLGFAHGRRKEEQDTHPLPHTRGGGGHKSLPHTHHPLPPPATWQVCNPSDGESCCGVRYYPG
jgi:hypothetical protein